LPEESAFLFGLAKKQIPRFVRDDMKLLFSAASKAVLLASGKGRIEDQKTRTLKFKIAQGLGQPPTLISN
jgi:hypothetical protein